MSRLGFFSRPAWRGVWLGLVCALLAWGLARLPEVHGLEDWILDGCFRIRGARSSQARIVVIGLDDESLRQLRKPLVCLSPELAEVVQYAHRQGAAAIGIDLLISEDLAGRPEVATPAGQLGDAIAGAGNVVLPQLRVEDGEEKWLRPLPQLRFSPDYPDRAAELATVNLTEDKDELIRRQQLLARNGDTVEPYFALALYARFQGQPISWDDTGRRLLVGDQAIPLDDEQKLRINFVGPPGTFRPLPFHEALAAARQGRPLPELDGAVVLIGATARGQQDYHPTPYANYYTRYLAGGDSSGFMSGTELHAHVLATLMDRAYVTTPVWLAPLPLLLLAGPLLGWVLARLYLLPGLLLAIGFHIGCKAASMAAFSALGWRIEVMGLLLLGGLTYAATFAWRWQSLRRMLGIVKSEAIALALEADPHRLDLGGEERTVTVLFADVRSFTDFSEKHTPHQVVALLNAYFGAVIPAIEAEHGTVMTYMGDGVMVLFGAPASLPDHALRAVRAAVAMVRQVHALRDTWARLDNPTLRIGVGVHTGKVLVGAIGSRRRLDYTAIGDTVNAAARIEAENKTFQTEVLISAATWAALPAEERARLGCAEEPRLATVKGKEEKLSLYPIAVP